MALLARHRPRSGVSIYRDGFPVLPYGEKGDDWLGLDARRVRNPTLALSNNQIVGYILQARRRRARIGYRGRDRGGLLRRILGVAAARAVGRCPVQRDTQEAGGVSRMEHSMDAPWRILVVDDHERSARNNAAALNRVGGSESVPPSG